MSTTHSIFRMPGISFVSFVSFVTIKPGVRKSSHCCGQSDPAVDLIAVTSSVGMNEGMPQRGKCLACHAKSGVGDNVRHGDLSTAMPDTTRDLDVHMGVDGGKMSCVGCHDVERTTEPVIAQEIATVVEWDGSTARQGLDEIPIDPVSGRPLYDKKKGTFVWGNDVRPELRVHDGTWIDILLSLKEKNSYGVQAIA